jgi:tRNA A-37 threonylcarbamoyl transferase component Bud32
MPGPEVRPLRSSPFRPPVHRGPGTLVGRVIGDRYRLIAPIAEGVASSVYKAEHVRMGKALCVKILRGPLARDPDLAARFRAEGRVVSRLSHPHTIAVFDFGELEANEGFYLAMEYLHGENLFDVLRREGRLPEARAAAIGDQLLGALGEAHEAGIVHRDVKPANVMLLQPKNDADFVKLLDFGIAEIEGQGPGGGLGTPAYLSPEQASGAAPDARSDLYSLGAMLYEMVGGRPPFVADNPLAVLSAHLHETPAPLRDLCPEVSSGFAEVVHRALAKRPQDRFRNSDEMRVALQAILEGRAATLVLGLPPGDAAGTLPAEPGAEPPAETTGEMEIARRVDFPLAPPPARRDPRRALLPAALVAVAALAILFAASKLHRPDPVDAEEREPNDAPAASGTSRYPQWLALGRLNSLVEGRGVRAAVGGEDVDTFAVESRSPAEPLDVVLLVPVPSLSLAVGAWTTLPAEPDRGADPGGRFETLAVGDPGQPVLARLPSPATTGSPVLVRVSAARGQGAYRILAIGPGEASGRAVMGVLHALVTDGRTDAALLVAAAFVHLEPGSPARADVLRLAGRLVQESSGNEKGAGPGRPTP